MVTWLTGGGDEMNGLDAKETRLTLERRQRVFTELFGEPARGFVAPTWQLGRVCPGKEDLPGPEHVPGFFSLETGTGMTGLALVALLGAGTMPPPGESQVDAGIHEL